MTERAPNQRRPHYDQGKQNITGSQTNIAGDQHIYVSTTAPAYALLPTIQLATIPVRSMISALSVGIIITIIGYFGRILLDFWPLALSFSLSLGLLLTTYNARTLRQEVQRRKESERNNWYTLSLSDLTLLLRQARWEHLRLMKDANASIPLTKQQRAQWLQLLDDIDLLKSLIVAQGGTPQSSPHDSTDPPIPPRWIRLFLEIKVMLSYLVSVLLIASAAYIGTTVPRATAALVIKFIHDLPIPLPTPIPEPTMTALPTLAPTPTGFPTAPPTVTPTAIPTLQPTFTITPTVGGVLVPTNTENPGPLPTATQNAISLATIATLVVTPAPAITTTVVPVPRTDLQRPSSTPPAEPTATATIPPTSTPTIALGLLTGRIAYPVLNGSHYDTLVRDVATNQILIRIERASQPDLRGGGYLLVNKAGGGLERVDINRGDEREITERDEDARPHWAPSDDRVVFESFEVDKGSTILKLQVNTTLQSNPPYLHSPTGGTIRGRNAIFLDDGRIAFNACGSWDPATTGACGIWSINTDGSGIVRLTDQPRDYPSDNFRSQLLFTSDRNNNWDVYITAGPGQVRRLTDHPARDGLATTSPSGDYIAFVSDRENGQWAVWVMYPDGAGQRKLFDIEGTFGSGDRDWTTEKISWGQ